MAFGIYIHWPFCKSKCPYCDFNSHVSEKIDHRQWSAAYLKELSYWNAQTKDRVVESVFFGGGTPSLMNPETVADILAYIKREWVVAPDCEITLEANPTSYESNKFKEFRAAGVNRVSIGVQSFREADLKFLGRTHDPQQAISAIQSAAQIFDRYSFDLIYARPHQTLVDWKDELGFALTLAGHHMSLYQLTIETGTPFHTQHERGEFRIPEQDHAADLYDLTQEMMEAAGLPAYEVSNHARKGEESRHNLIYWRYGDYIGVGPGAHGRVKLDGAKWATRAHRAPEIWLQKVGEGGHGLHPLEEVEPKSQLHEAVMMGLRLREGVPRAVWQGAIPEDRIAQLVSSGILEADPTVLKTTPQGFKCLNSVLKYLLLE